MPFSNNAGTQRSFFAFSWKRAFTLNCVDVSIRSSSRTISLNDYILRLQANAFSSLSLQIFQSRDNISLLLRRSNCKILFNGYFATVLIYNRNRIVLYDDIKIHSSSRMARTNIFIRAKIERYDFSWPRTVRRKCKDKELIPLTDIHQRVTYMVEFK